MTRRYTHENQVSVAILTDSERNPESERVVLMAQVQHISVLNGCIKITMAGGSNLTGRLLLFPLGFERENNKPVRHFRSFAGAQKHFLADVAAYLVGFDEYGDL